MATRLPPSCERLVVSIDPDPREHRGNNGAYSECMRLLDELRDLGVYIKLNTLLRWYGYSLIEEVHERDFPVFADLKLYDIPSTMERDALMLRPYQPEILTVIPGAGIEGMRRVQEQLDYTKVFAVINLSSQTEEAEEGFTCTGVERMRTFAERTNDAGLRGFVADMRERQVLKDFSEVLFSVVTPGIRPSWADVPNDDQKRTMTPAEAIWAGALRIVVGRPITQAQSPRDAALRIIEEIEKTSGKRKRRKKTA